jgi:hypothetical protein
MAPDSYAEAMRVHYNENILKDIIRPDSRVPKLSNYGSGVYNQYETWLDEAYIKIIWEHDVGDSTSITLGTREAYLNGKKLWSLQTAPYTLEPFQIKTFNQASEPSASDIQSGKMAIWTDTDDSKCYLCYNHGGTVKTIEMT